MKLLNPLWAKVCYGLALFMFVAVGASAQDGCTTATNGQYPTESHTPECDGEEESITTLAYAGEYSVVNVVNGESYIFSSDISTDYLTISSNETDPSTVYASGVTPVSWDATFDGEIRFYTHTNSDCGESTAFRDRNIQCGEITYDCPQLEVDFGDPCDDGDETTFDDSYNENCECEGTPYDCPEELANIGDECDDGDPLTANDAYNESCECVGESVSPGQVCEDPLMVSSLPYTTSDNTSNYVDDYDGDDVPAVAGDAVTNGTGSTSYLTGDDAVYSYTPSTDMAIDISLANISSSGWVGLWVFTGCPFNSTVGYHTNTSSDDRLIPALPVTAGTTYYIVISSWPPPQSTPYDLTIEETSFDCPELDANIGDDCDDGDETTFDDVITEECDCMGTPYDCPSLLANVGDDCDDEDETTFDDVITEECECAGTPYDCPENLANIGDDCDDGDPDTSFDQYNDECDCAGFLPAENDDCADATALSLDADPITVSNIGATPDGTAPDCWIEFIPTVHNDVWFTFVAPEDGEIVIETFETVIGNENDDTQLQILDACDGNEIACDDDGGADFMSRILLECGEYTPGATYYVQVDGYSGAEGPFDISVTSGPCFDCPDLQADIGESCDDGDPNTSMETATEDCECVGTPIPSNNIPCAAGQISCGSENAITGVLDGATALPEFPACDGSSDALGRWYRFNAAGNIDYTLMETGDDNIDVQVYSGTCNDLNEVECTTSGEDEIELGVLPAGTYYVHLLADPDVDFEDANDFTVELMCTEVDCSSPTLETSIVDSENNPIENCQEVGEQYFVVVSFTGGSGNTSYQVSINSDDAVEVEADASETFGPFDASEETDVEATGTEENDCVVSATVASEICPSDIDDCTQAALLECGQPVEGNTTGATTSGLDVECNGFTGDGLDEFYTFEADGESSYNVTVGESEDAEDTFDAVLHVYSGACGELVSEGCSDSSFGSGSEQISLDAPEAGTYTVRVFDWSGTEAYVVNLECIAPPECEDPGLVLNTVDESGAPIDDCLPADGSFFVEASFDGGSGNDSYNVTANDGDPVEVAADGSNMFGPFDSGTEVDVVATGVQDDQCGADGSASVAVCPPDNEEACDAQAINCGQTLEASSIGATESLAPIACGGFTAPSPAQDVWFSFTSDGNSNYTIETELGFDAIISVYSGSCDAPVYEDCADNTISSEPEVLTLSGLEAGTYFIRIYEYASEDSFTISLSCEEPLENDEACDALDLNCDEVISGTTSGSSESLAPIACDDFTALGANDVWFTFTADGSSDYTISETGEGSDVVLELFSADGCDNLTSVQCTDFDESEFNVGVLEAGEYYVRLYSYFESGFGSPFTDYEITLFCGSPAANVDITTDIACEKDLTVSLYEPGTANLVDEFSGTTDASGDFSISGVTPGEYEVYIQVDGFLQSGETITLEAGSNSLDFGSLNAGELAGDNNFVDALDLSALIGAYQTQSGDPNFIESADFDCNGTINGLDLSALIGNYQESGETPISSE